jgi:hypothetical protein
MLGPWSDTAVRLVWVEPAGAAFQVCTQLVDTTSFSAMGVASCRITQTRPAFLGDAVNGTVDDFQVVFAPVSGRGAQVWRFVNGAWAPGSFITAAALFQTPTLHGAVRAAVRGWTHADAGHRGKGHRDALHQHGGRVGAAASSRRLRVTVRFERPSRRP